MPDQIDEKWRSGQKTPAFNAATDTRRSSERLNDVNTRAERLPLEDRELYRHMVETQEKDYSELLSNQENAHRSELERLTSDFLKDKEGFNLENTSPKVRREIAEKKAVRVMAETENREQESYLKRFLAQREGFVEYSEVEVARSQAKQDKANESSESKGKSR